MNSKDCYCLEEMYLEYLQKIEMVFDQKNEKCQSWFQVDHHLDNLPQKTYHQERCCQKKILEGRCCHFQTLDYS